MTDHLLSLLSREALAIVRNDLGARLELAEEVLKQHEARRGGRADDVTRRAVLDACLSGWGFTVKEARNLDAQRRAEAAGTARSLKRDASAPDPRTPGPDFYAQGATGSPPPSAATFGTFTDNAGKVHRVKLSQNRRARVRVHVLQNAEAAVHDLVRVGLRWNDHDGIASGWIDEKHIPTLTELRRYVSKVEYEPAPETPQP